MIVKLLYCKTREITEEDKLSICNPIVHTDKVYRVKTYSLK